MVENSENKDLHLRVSVGEITIEVDGPVDEAETWFESLRKDYLSDIDAAALEAASKNNTKAPPENPNSSQNPTSDSTQTMAGKSRTLTEYYREADNPTKRDTALIVGWYLECKEGQDDFTKPEVEQRATDAKITLGANVSRDLSKQVKDGYLAKVDERGGKDAYHLTLSGEDYIEDELLE